MGTADQTSGGDFDIGAMLFERASATDPKAQALRHLDACYRKARKDPAARIPSYLEAALLNVASLK